MGLPKPPSNPCVRRSRPVEWLGEASVKSGGYHEYPGYSHCFCVNSQASCDARFHTRCWISRDSQRYHPRRSSRSTNSQRMLAVLSVVKVALLVPVLRRFGVVRGSILEHAIGLVVSNCDSLNRSPGYPSTHIMETLDASN
jgi:hypothetical protein